MGYGIWDYMADTLGKALLKLPMTTVEAEIPKLAVHSPRHSTASTGSVSKCRHGSVHGQAPPATHIRPELDIGYRLTDQSVEIFGIRPQWDNPAITRERPFSKATYVNSNLWKVF